MGRGLRARAGELMKKVSINELALLTEFNRRTIESRLENVDEVEGPTKNARYFKSQEALKAIFEVSNSGKEKLQQKKLENDVELSTIKVRREKGELVEIDNVSKEVGNLFAVVRQNFLSVPSKAAQDLSHETDPKKIQEILFDMVNECLADLQKYEDTKNGASKKAQGKPKARSKAKSGRVGRPKKGS